MGENKIELKGLNQKQLENFCLEMQIEKFRAKQIAHWIYQKNVNSFTQMSNLSRQQKEILTEKANLSNLEELKIHTSSDGTSKFLWQLEDKNSVETVLLPYEEKTASKDRITVCISSQVGCAMGCVFCATGLQGFVRNLTAGEIVDQVLQVNKRIKPKRVSNIVIMGMGEPLLNYDNILQALDIFHSQLEISLRRITLSTCGIVPKIKRLAEEKLPLVLAISLHAPNNDLRTKLMPINKKYPLEVLLPVCAQYIEKTGRRITFEYSLLQEINDSPEQAHQLVALLKNLFCHVNLIPVNPVAGSIYCRPDKYRVKNFKTILEEAGLAVSIREEKGVDIWAACGQLRQKEAKNNGNNICSRKMAGKDGGRFF